MENETEWIERTKHTVTKGKRNLIAEFETFLDSEYQYIDYIGFNSMEQLWLAFTMDKKYNKRWSEGEWVKA